MKKIIVISVIALFIGVGFQPAFANDNSCYDEINEDNVLDVSGIGKPSQPVLGFVNPREGYFHIYGVQLFKTIFNFLADTANIGGFRLRPIQVKCVNGNPENDSLMVWLFINGEDKGFGTWNPETEYYEWQWTEWAHGEYTLRLSAIDENGYMYPPIEMCVWNLCFNP